MIPIAANRMAEVDTAPMYYLNSQPWLPHYTKPHIFVAPGGYEKTEHQLISLGARKKIVALWMRSWQKKK